MPGSAPRSNVRLELRRRFRLRTPTRWHACALSNGSLRSTSYDRFLRRDEVTMSDRGEVTIGRASVEAIIGPLSRGRVTPLVVVVGKSRLRRGSTRAVLITFRSGR